MEQQFITIEGIPAILWGPPSDRLLIAVHGDQSHKADQAIAAAGEEAIAEGLQVLSFDLPEHGDRSGEPRLCKVQNCIEDLRTIHRYAAAGYREISLFGCSLGAYFSMMAYRDKVIQQALFLSPVVDMKRIIQNMMKWAQVSEAQLKEQQEIRTPFKTLYWDYYEYVCTHPVEWNKPTALLYGAKDELCEYDYVKAFAERWSAELTVAEDCEHYFHTPEHMTLFRTWFRDNISIR